jgi:hypothetical protein
MQNTFKSTYRSFVPKLVTNRINLIGLTDSLVLGIALLPISWQSWRVATRNPLEALRYE